MVTDKQRSREVSFFAVCHKQLDFGRVDRLEVIADFEGGEITSDSGAILLKEIDRKYQVTEGATACLVDGRAVEKIKHELMSILRQRVFQIALGYEDQNDANDLRKDPGLKVMVDRCPEDEDLSSQSTLSRFENSRGLKELYALADFLVRLFIRLQPEPPKSIILDIDATDDPTHGQQQFSFFHGYYDQYMYHPLLIFDGQSGFPLAAVLRPGNTHSSHMAISILKRVVARLRAAYPEVTILVRGDAGFAVPALYDYCEEHDLLYVIGLITNDRLRGQVADLAAEAEKTYQAYGEKQRQFTEFWYQAGSWPHARRVVAKVERLDKGSNQRFVVTNLPLAPRILYDWLYTPRGEAENRIKELKNHLKADRLSCSRFGANQFRLLLHTLAYVLFLLLREHLEDTELERAYVDTIRLKLLKIGARVRQTTRRIWFHMASGYPHRHLFTMVLDRIRAAPG